MQNTPIVIVAIVVLVAAVRVWRFSLQKPAPASPPPIEHIDDFMAYHARKAVDIAKTMDTHLDYTESSIQRADEALEKIRQAYAKMKTEEGMWGLSIMFGAYVGEVIRRREPQAYWNKDHPSMGESTFPLFLGKDDICAFPVTWCHKRMLNGEEDNIVSKFRLTRERQKYLKSGQ